MPRPFIHDDFLLDGAEARRLYHDYAEAEPIIDYHCHLSPREIAEDRRFENIAEVWLEGDHYKWRAMRANGIPERLVTGDAPWREKFDAFAATMPYLLRNPLYHWTQLELKRYFGIDDLLSAETAEGIWGACNEQLESLSARGMMSKMDVRLVCTTDDPADSLEWHDAIAKDDSFPIRVLPTWRPDKALAAENPDALNAWIDRLSERVGHAIDDFDALWSALKTRHAEFHAAGCRLSDHGLSKMYAEPVTREDAAPIFDRLRKREAVIEAEAVIYKSAMLYELAKWDAERGWVQQFHIGALRNNSSRLYSVAGPDSGGDSIGDASYAESLNGFLNRLDAEGCLAKTIVYNLNPRDNAMIASALGNFQDGSVPGKMQFGSAWWFLDQKDGIEAQIECLSQFGLLSRFVGMLTDSRSFLSYPRHEYFRRIVANMLGRDMRLGLLPDNSDLVGGMLRNICYTNARDYFDFDDV